MKSVLELFFDDQYRIYTGKDPIRKNRESLDFAIKEFSGDKYQDCKFDISINRYVPLIMSGTLDQYVELAARQKKFSMMFSRKKREEYNYDIQELAAVVPDANRLKAKPFWNYANPATAFAYFAAGLPALAYATHETILQFSPDAHPNPIENLTIPAAIFGIIGGLMWMHILNRNRKTWTIEARNQARILQDAYKVKQ